MITWKAAESGVHLPDAHGPENGGLISAMRMSDQWAWGWTTDEAEDPQPSSSTASIFLMGLI